MIWNTRIIDFLGFEQLSPGFLTESPYYKGNPLLRKANLEYHYTIEEQDNIAMSATITWFVDMFVYNTIGKIKLRGYQEDLLNAMKSNRFNLIASSRQMGVSTMLAIFALHECMEGRSISYVAPSTSMAEDFIEKVKSIYFRLPFYLKPGVETWNAKSVTFDNGGKLFARGGGSTQENEKRKVDTFIIESTSLVSNSKEIIKNFMLKASETSDSRVILHTTEATDKLREIYRNRDKNSFVVTELNYNLIPDRNQEWVDEQIKIFGSREKFEKEYKFSFDEPVTEPHPEVMPDEMGDMLNVISTMLQQNINNNETMGILNKMFELMKYMANKNSPSK